MFIPLDRYPWSSFFVHNPSLSLVVIRVSDIEYSARFYSALGLNFQSEKHGSGPEHYSTQIEGVTLELYPASERFPITSVRFGFNVTSIERVLAALQGLNHEIISESKDSPWGLHAVIVDPDGHRIELTQI